MLRVSLTFAVSLAAVTFFASPANAATDPRICKTSDGRPVPRLDCAKGAASLDFRRYMTRRMQSKYLYAASITCRGFAGLLRFRCDFQNAAETGYAIVSLGTAPLWKPTVTMKQMVCTLEPERVGCPTG